MVRMRSYTWLEVTAKSSCRSGAFHLWKILMVTFLPGHLARDVTYLNVFKAIWIFSYLHTTAAQKYDEKSAKTVLKMSIPRNHSLLPVITDLSL